jgi:hypothetical protein
MAPTHKKEKREKRSDFMRNGLWHRMGGGRSAVNLFLAAKIHPVSLITKCFLINVKNWADFPRGDILI